MSRILHVIFGMTYGGAETMLVDIANQQVQNNEVHLMVLNEHIDEILIRALDKAVVLHRINRLEGSKNIFFYVKFILYLYLIRPDVIHCHSARLSYLLKYPFAQKVYTQHCSLDIVDWDPKLLNNFDVVFAISNFVRESIIKKGVTAPVIIVHNSLCVDSILSKENYLLDKTFKIIQVARLEHEVKGQHILIEALRILKERNIKVHVDFIGEGPSNEYLVTAIKKHNLEEDVSILGLKDRNYVYSHLRDYDLMCHPSLCEGFGLTIAEGMIAGLPVLVSEDDGPVEVINNGDFGYLAPKNNPQKLAAKIEEIIRNYPNNVNFYKKAQKHAYKQFSIDNMVSKMNEFYFK